MLEMRPNCELCNADLPPDATNVLICSLECTFCTECDLDKCPNCGGLLSPRPTRVGAWVEKYPASTKRVLKQG
ncbi:DUF1272 domain-containing protein [Fretibacter rubidus]|uniref:DUF1272 domain-containing protein n=1 Tax=Fretibacter rubidus TaxID=570162 RepID=UPI00352B0471